MGFNSGFKGLNKKNGRVYHPANKQGRQYNYNVTLNLVRVTIVAVEKQ